jgi:RHS repeat-associated protein
MKRYYIVAAVILHGFSALAQTSSKNYVMTETMLDSKALTIVKSVQYYDGLGRPSILAAGGVNQQGNYLYTLQKYDWNGRESDKYLPGVGGATPDYLDAASVQSLAQQSNNDSRAYYKTTYDPLNRPTFISTPGNAWQGRGKTIRYITNEANSVKRYNGNKPQPMFVDYYPAGALTGEVVMDEDSVEVTTFKDVAGRVVLERRGDGDDTYYVYKSNGLLRYILSPMYQESTSTNYRYRYDYDDKGRLTKKTLPGGQYVYYWYDSDNRLILERDSRLTSKSKNRFFLYDRLGRLAVQGTCTAINSNCPSPVYVSRSVIGNEVCGTGYYVSSNYTLSNPQIEIVNYYDNYDFLEGSFFTDSVSSTNLQGTCQGLTASLKTGDITATSDGHYLARTFYYDAKAHIIDQRETTLDGSTLRTSTTYSFTGKPLTVQTTLDANSQTFVIDESYAYDVLTNQLLSHDVEYEDSTVRVGSYSYNQLGRLATEFKSDSRIGQTYSYNLQGWLTGITATKLYNGYSNFFSQHLYYESGCGTPCYNGNISAMKWKTLKQPYGNGYRFSYDKRNRLTEATYSNYSDLSILPYVYSETMTYNRNSAITTLVRTGNSQAGYGNMDFLQYAYVGNKLKSINDMGSSNVYDGAFEFVDGSSNTQEYWYNAAGDLTRDANKGIALINYDLLGHPTRVQFTNGNVTEYVYAADGRKLRTKQTTAIDGLTVPMGQTLDLAPAQTMHVDTTDYDGPWMFRKRGVSNVTYVDAISYHFDNGYITFLATLVPQPLSVPAIGYIPQFHYYVRDHLGSNRMVVGSDGSVEQKNQYYPYGGPWGDVSTNQGFQPFKFNDKELDRVHGLDWYDYGARRYDPAIGLFIQMDPLCEQYPHLSPYAYCAGNPVRYVDPDGRRIIYSGFTEEEKDDWVSYLEHLCQKSDLFKTLFSQLTNSHETYKITLADLSNNKGSKHGFFIPNGENGGTITFSNNGERYDYVTLEELFHAYQHDNRNGYANGEFNREFEAKTFVVSAALGEGVQMSWGNYQGMNDMIEPIFRDYFKDTNFAISPAAVNSSVFRFLYTKVANSYGMFNATQGIGKSPYHLRTTVLPYSLIKIIMDTSLKNWRE